MATSYVDGSSMSWELGDRLVDGSYDECYIFYSDGATTVEIDLDGYYSIDKITLKYSWDPLGVGVVQYWNGNLWIDITLFPHIKKC